MIDLHLREDDLRVTKQLTETAIMFCARLMGMLII